VFLLSNGGITCCPPGLERIVPRRNEKNFTEWWRKVSNRVEKAQRKGFNSAVILGAWTLWNHRNRGME
jgi:hypothetical protein